MLITFDDGHARNFSLFELLIRYNVRPVIFLVTSVAGTKKPFWFKLPGLKQEEKEHLKTLPDEQRHEYLNQHYKEMLQKEYRHSLSWEEILKMAGSVDFFSHTQTHPCLPLCDENTIHSELIESKNEIEHKLSSTCFAIAYPNGDLNDKIKKITFEVGYMMGFAIRPGFVTKKSERFEIPRLSTNDTSDQNEFVLRITGTWFMLKMCKKFFRK